jgi:hypothetical protein
MPTPFVFANSTAFPPPPERGRVGWGSAGLRQRLRVWRATPSPPSPFQGEGVTAHGNAMQEVH